MPEGIVEHRDPTGRFGVLRSAVHRCPGGDHPRGDSVDVANRQV